VRDWGVPTILKNRIADGHHDGILMYQNGWVPPSPCVRLVPSQSAPEAGTADARP
jgi:hypothetical protein